VAESQWGEDLIASWNVHGWIDWPTRIAAKLAPIVGAKPSELLVADSTSVCLFKLLAAAARARPGRRTILTQRRNFPTDLYVAQGLADMLGLTLKAVPADDVIGAIDADTAVVTLTHTDYRSAAFHDMAATNAAAHAAGALLVWDLSHSAGAMHLDPRPQRLRPRGRLRLQISERRARSAGFRLRRERLQAELHSPLQGWMGHAEPFAFDDAYAARRHPQFLTGTPRSSRSPRSTAGLDTFAGHRDARRRGQGAALTQLSSTRSRHAAGRRFGSIAPRPRPSAAVTSCSLTRRLCRHAGADRRGVIGDFRAPDLMRFGFTAALHPLRGGVAGGRNPQRHPLIARSGTTRASWNARR
jgi:kynureninase